jgi:hypothetical protein
MKMGICKSTPVQVEHCEECSKNGIIHVALNYQGLLKLADLSDQWQNCKTIMCYDIIQNNQIEKFKKMYMDGNLVVIKQSDYSCPSTIKFNMTYKIYKYHTCKIEFNDINLTNCTNCFAYYLE